MRVLFLFLCQGQPNVYVTCCSIFSLRPTTPLWLLPMN